MKKYLVGLMGLTLLSGSALWGQEPLEVPVSTAHESFAPSVGAEACCTPTKTICVREQYMKQTVKPAYSSVCEPICLPYRCDLVALCQWLRHEDCDCKCCPCTKPYTKKYLVKKLKTTEKCEWKCVPQTVPCDHCGSDSCTAPASPAPGTPELVLPPKPAETK